MIEATDLFETRYLWGKGHMTVTLEPQDEHNAALLAATHPPRWTNPRPRTRYNLVVIGAGTAGLVAAAGSAGLGAQVALVERHLMGGDCLNYGCVPSKALIRAARAIHEVRTAHELGVEVPDGASMNFPAVMQRMRRLRASIAPHDSAERFTSLGVDVFLGQARFLDASTVEVGNQPIKFRTAIIATGGRAVRPKIDGLEEVGYLTNETVFSLTELPRRFLVIGGGPIGCELAQTFQRFGSSVTLVQRSERLLPKDDAAASAIVTRHLTAEGVAVRLQSQVARVESTATGKRIHFAHDTEQPIEVDAILVSAGRVPNVEGLGLDAAGVRYDTKRGVEVNDYFQTSNKQIYAAGDIAGHEQFTHAADFMARNVIRNALFFGRAKHSKMHIPWATYTTPEVAHIGLTVAEAERRNVKHQVFEQPLDKVDRAILDGQTDGFVKVVADPKGKILGATIVAENAGDLISLFSFAMTNGQSLGALASSIFPYPTQAEAVRRVGDQYNRTRLTPFVSRLFKTWLAWLR
jgi:pyruvate/2-oxoglutarate dehydrogenase complex dihydrolipoamide dehydrogenase (E3) component